MLADAIAIAAQSLIASTLSNRLVQACRTVIRLSLLWGAAAGVLIGTATYALHTPICLLFSSDAAVVSAAQSIWPLVASSQLLSSLAFTVKTSHVPVARLLSTQFVRRPFDPTSAVRWTHLLQLEKPLSLQYSENVLFLTMLPSANTNYLAGGWTSFWCQ